MPMSDDDDDDTDDVTMFEPNPWGARQRIAPRRTFKAAVSKIITLVPDLVRQLPPPLPARRLAAGTPAGAAPIVHGLPRPRAERQSDSGMLPVRPTPLPPPTPTVGALAIASLAFATPHHAYAVPSLVSAKRPIRRAQTWPAMPRAPRTKRILAAAAGGMLVLIVALAYMLSTRPDAATVARAQIGASLARNTTSPIVVPMTVTPIEEPAAAAAPTVTPTITELSPDEPLQEPAKPAAKKRSKKPRRIVAGDTSTPLGNLRPSR